MEGYLIEEEGVAMRSRSGEALGGERKGVAEIGNGKE